MSKTPVAKPSIGRMVRYRTSFADEQWNGASEHAAMITGVVSDVVVHLTVFPAGQSPLVRMGIGREESFKTIEGWDSAAWAWPALS